MLGYVWFIVDGSTPFAGTSSLVITKDIVQTIYMKYLLYLFPVVSFMVQ